MKILTIFVLPALLLSACATPGRGTVDIAYYDLGVAAPVVPNAAVAHAGVALEVRLPAWQDGTAILYRLAYADSQRVHQYAKARWLGQPSPMLQQYLRQSLAIAPGSAPCTLRVELDEFSHVFEAAASSRAELRGEAMLLGKGRAMQARLPLRIEKPAATADAPGGVHALAAAAQSAATVIGNWLQQQDLSGCRTKT